jgi:hypothetical protein
MFWSSEEVSRLFNLYSAICFFCRDFVSVPTVPICLIDEALKTHVSEEA